MARRELEKWEPFREMRSLWDQVDRLFSDFFGRFPLERRVQEVGYPSVDVEETKDNVIITAELPGMKKKEINITVGENALTISGEKKREKEEKGRTFYRAERSYGKFERTIPLPCEVEPNKANARFENGVLTINLPKSEKAKPKEISVKIE